MRFLLFYSFDSAHSSWSAETLLLQWWFTAIMFG
jgi:hypothetical protein